MTLRIRVVLALALVSAAAPSVVRAQTGSAATARDSASTTTSELASLPQPSAASLALADTLLTELHADSTISAAMKMSFATMARSQPALAAYRDVFDAWTAKYLSWKEFGPPTRRLYAQEFTDDELRTLIAFYATPIGQKLASKQAELAQRGAEIGRSLSEKYQPEFQEMIRARLATPPDTTH